jgi:exoribonuclease R
MLDSIAEYSVDNSIIKPTYMLTYESASELLHMNLDEEAELKLLSEAASLRLQWRCEQVGLNIQSNYVLNMYKTVKIGFDKFFPSSFLYLLFLESFLDNFHFIIESYSH